MTRWAVAVGAVLLGGPASAQEKDPTKGPQNLDSFRYDFAPTALGSCSTFTVSGRGKVTYTYWSPANTGTRTRLIQKEWDVSPREAQDLLRGLLADGLLDLEDVRAGRFPNHYFEVTCDRWELSSHLKELPRPILTRLRPYLHKAHPEVWK
jgi:hypothetical protein